MKIVCSKLCFPVCLVKNEKKNQNLSDDNEVLSETVLMSRRVTYYLRGRCFKYSYVRVNQRLNVPPLSFRIRDSYQA
jgi:hypothetical protein